MALIEGYQRVSHSSDWPVKVYRDDSVEPNPQVQAFVLLNAAGTIISPATSTIASSIANGSKNVTTAGTAETLVAATTACKKVDIMALDTNTGKIWIGGSTIDKTAKNGKYIFAAQSYTIEIDDLVKIYIDADTNGEGVVFTYYN